LPDLACNPEDGTAYVPPAKPPPFGGFKEPEDARTGVLWIPGYELRKPYVGPGWRRGAVPLEARWKLELRCALCIDFRAFIDGRSQKFAAHLALLVLLALLALRMGNLG